MKLSELFSRCLNATYIHTECGGDYAIDLDGDTLYLFFECSDGKEDWINNFDFIPDNYEERDETSLLASIAIKAGTVAISEYLNLPVKPYKDMPKSWRVHGVFLKVWKAMQNEIEYKVAKHLLEEHQINNIVCVGYSHGGALSLLATEDMAFLYGDRINVSGYGFGAPRVLWGIIPKTIKSRLKGFKVIRNIPDLVTHVPPALFGFSHGGKVVKIGKRGKYNMIKAHRPESYIAELELLEERTDE